MMQKIALPLVCLLIGGVTGYGLRSVNDGPSTAKETSSNGQGKARTISSAGAAASGLGGTASVGSSSGSLADQMKELLVDFDPKSARKGCAHLSIAEIQSALALVAAMPKSLDRDALRAQLYRAWAAKDPQAAWKAAMADPVSKTNGILLGAVAGELAKTNPNAAADLARSVRMGEVRSTVLRTLFMDWSMVDVTAAMAYSNAHPDLPVESYSFTAGLVKLADTDPTKAANAALSIADIYSRGSTLTALMRKWMENDPNTAVAWAQSLTNPALRKDAIASAVSAWARTDPKAAFEFAQSIQDPDMRQNTLKKGWSDWFRQDPGAATAYLASSKNDQLLQNLAFSFGYMTESLTPKERAALLAQIPEGKPKQDILRAMTDGHIRKGQFNQALELLNGMPDSSQRDNQVVKLSEEWALSNRDAAAAWLKMQPDSTDRDLATAGYASTLARTDPQGALKWVESIPDPKVRQGATRSVATRWLKNDPPRAEAWMAGASGLTESDKKLIRTMAGLSGDYVSTIINVGNRR